MKKSATIFMALSGILLILPAVTFTQNIPVPKDKKLSIHREVQDDPYMPNPFGNKKTSPAKTFRGSGIFTTQVNVNANGENILGDAANEPSIAIDPTDPNKMVIGWRQFDNVFSNFRQAGYGYSADAGQTWTFPGTIETGIFRSDPVLGSDSNGYVYYNSLTSNFGVYTCKVFKSDDGGAQWNAGVQAHGGDKQWMTIDRSGGPGSGNIYSFWTSYYSSCYPGFFTRSTDTASSFEDCLEVIGNPYWGTMTVGNDGELYIGGSGNYGDIVVVKSTTAWNPAFPVIWDYYSNAYMDGYITAGMNVNPGGLLGQASIDVDRSNGPGRGNVYVLASVARISNNDSADVMFSKSVYGGLTWSDPIRINDDEGTDHYQWFGTMSTAPNGRIDVVWLDTRDAPTGSVMSALYYSYSTNQGESFSVNERISELFDPHVGWPDQNKMGDYFDMKSDNDGAHLAWANTLNGEQDVYYSYITPDVTGLQNGSENKDLPSLSSYPNPFNDRTTIGFTVRVTSEIKIMIFDVLGKAVKTLVDEKKQPGMYHADWVSDLPAGYYECRLSAGTQTKHIGLVKTK
jgi:Secretion system C-terminal sorting domain